jgi:hypothetical protein
MRKLRLSVLTCLAIVAIGGAMQLAGCTNGGQPSNQGMIEGRGTDYNH